MNIWKKSFFLLLLIICFHGCRSYIIDKESAAQQMTNLKIKKNYGSGIAVNVGNGIASGNTHYTNGLKYLIIKNELHFDTIVPSDINLFCKSGLKSGYANPHNLIFKDGYFIFFNDTTLKTHPKCKTCKIHIDSIEKIVIRGSRINKVK